MWNAAFGALINNHATGLGSTFNDGINDLSMRIGHGHPKRLNILGAKGTENFIN